MSATIETAQRRRALLLATTIFVLNATLAHAQNVASTELPPVDVSPPTDQNKTRARPVYDESGGAPRPTRVRAPSLKTTLPGFRSMLSSASTLGPATAARCSMATVRSAASSTS